jgi:lyso-ornithine lipid O-acyltransferase
MIATLPGQSDKPVRHQRFGPAKGVTGALAMVALLLPMVLALQLVGSARRLRLVTLFHRGLARSLGIRIVSHGAPVRRRGVLFVANHVSWADIAVLGARLPAAFIAKSEVGGWGFFGWLATLGRTIYIERSRRSSTGSQRDAIAERLAAGDSLILFPEGTNSDGTRVLPFKSALFAVTDSLPDVLVQPVTIAYTRVNGIPVTRRQLPDLAWVGDTELIPHAVAFMALGRVRAEIRFHAAVHASDFANRKALAQHCHTVISNGYRDFMRG